jgi:hypothetical protein
VTGTLTVRFAFQAHEYDDDGFTPSNEFVYRTGSTEKRWARSVTLGAVLVESGRNKTVDVTLSDCFFYMRRRNVVWGPHADGGSQEYEGRPSVQFFVPSSPTPTNTVTPTNTTTPTLTPTVTPI